MIFFFLFLPLKAQRECISLPTYLLLSKDSKIHEKKKTLNCQSPTNMQLFQAGVLSKNVFFFFVAETCFYFLNWDGGGCFASGCSNFSGHLPGSPVLTHRGEFPWAGPWHLGWIKCQFWCPLVHPLVRGEHKVISLTASQSPSFQDVTPGCWAVNDRRAWEGGENRWSRPYNNTGEIHKGK